MTTPIRQNTNLRNKSKKIRQIAVDIDKEILARFREIIYHKTGLKKGDFQQSLEEAMLEYVLKYSKSEKTKDLAKRVKGDNR